MLTFAGQPGAFLLHARSSPHSFLIDLGQEVLNLGYSEKWKKSANAIKLEVYTLCLAYKDPRVPWYARLLAACVIAYALSPIDLIPDPIPVVGYLDDIILLPVGIYLVLKMIPPEVIEECRQKAEIAAIRPGAGRWIAAGVIILIWIVAAGLLIRWMV